MGNIISSFTGAAEVKEWRPSKGRRAGQLEQSIQDPDAVCHDERTSSARINSASEHDWHAEMLCGLFMRSDERELIWLEREVGASSPTAHRRSLFAKHGENHLEEGGKEEEKHVADGHTDHAGSFGGGSFADLLPTDQKSSSNYAYLNVMLQLEKSTDSAVLSLIPEALRGLPTQISTGHSFNDKDMRVTTERTQEISEAFDSRSVSLMEGKNKNKNESPDDSDNPLLVPPSWRRWNYASRTLPELQRHLMDQFSCTVRANTISFNSDVKINGKMGSFHLLPQKGLPTFELFTILYNECSLTAIANWAISENPIGDDNSTSHDKTKAQLKDNCNEDTEKHRSTSKAQYKMSIPPSKFHLCGVCGKIGHHEVECNVLFDDKKRGRENELPDKFNDSGRKKIRLQDDVPRKSLDENEKVSVITGLSREVHIQKRQRQLLENDTSRDIEGSVVVIPPALASDSVTSSRVGVDGEKGGEDHYSGESYWCKICLSGIDDGEMLVCDGCDGLFHCKCLDPPLTSIPEGDWFCSSCLCYDSDVSSNVDIEGCDGFVIEQRNHLLAQKDKLNFGVNRGQVKCSWTTALSLSAEQDPYVKDELYIRKHLRQERGRQSDVFFPGELCWSKRSDDRLGRVDWWPAMVSQSKSRSLKSFSKTTQYTVTFFALDEVVDTPETDVLSFLPYYEDIGHKRLMRCENSDHATFRQALILAVSRLGLKSLGQALKFARNGIQLAAITNTEHRKLMPSRRKIPVGWESAEIEKVDGMVILAMDRTDIDSSVEKYCNSVPSSGSPNEESNPVQVSSVNKMKAQFCEDEIMGSIVSWQSDFGSSNSSERSGIRYGLVISIDVPADVVLVQTVIYRGFLDAFLRDSNDILPNANNIGATSWLPLSEVRFVSGKPNCSDLAKFRRKLLSSIGHENDSYSKQCAMNAQFREEFTLELVDEPDQFFSVLRTD